MHTLKNITEVEGKKLKKSHVNLLAKLADKYGVTLADNAAERVNPFTNARRMLCPLAVSLYDFIIVNYHNGLVKGSTMASMSNPNAIPTATWDSARYMFLTYWPEAYYDLID